MGESQPKTPYGDVLHPLQMSIKCALKELVRAKFEASAADIVLDVDINRHFVWLATAFNSGENRHFFDPGAKGNRPLRTQALRLLGDVSLKAKLNERKSISQDDVPDLASANSIVPNGPTRISQLIRNSWTRSQEFRSSKSNIIIPSPLSILFDFLTVPSIPSTRAYALMSVRNYIYEMLDTYPSPQSNKRNEKYVTIKEIDEASSKLWTYLRPRYESRGNDSFPSIGLDNADALIRNFFAARGFFFLKFDDLKNFYSYCDAHIENLSKFEFVRAPDIARLPDQGEIVNELFGIPIPLRGADTIFRGGIRLSARQGLVTAIHGNAGTGKTSLALALAASLAPYGIDTLYLTAEESEDDLMGRIEGLIPEDIRRLSIARKPVNKWLSVQKVNALYQDPDELLAKLKSNLELIAVTIDESLENKSGDQGPPIICRALVILDGLRDLFSRSLGIGRGDSGSKEVRRALHNFIDVCRQMKALVVLTTGDDWLGADDLDYLVDVSLRLEHANVEDIIAKPQRKLVLTKARHQACAPGAHGFQISGPKGVRFSPQANYQVERRTVWKSRLSDQLKYKDVLQKAVSDSSIGSSEFDMIDTIGIKIYSGASVFINGDGSGGKAALALKIAMAPTFHKKASVNTRARSKLELVRDAEKILVISFLYPSEYYISLRRKLNRTRSKENDKFREFLTPPQMEVIHLYPGYLRPEDLFNRIEWTLQEAELNGRPFTSVIIDGIHNVFIQFPEIEVHKLIWPQIYTALHSRRLGVITTHTTLILQGSGLYKFDMSIDDQRSEPLRHVLVQKTDFHLELNPSDTDAGSRRLFDLNVISAIAQPIPTSPLVWDREELVFVSSPEQLNFPLFKKDGLSP